MSEFYSIACVIELLPVASVRCQFLWMLLQCSNIALLHYWSMAITWASIDRVFYFIYTALWTNSFSTFRDQCARKWEQRSNQFKGWPLLELILIKRAHLRDIRWSTFSAPSLQLLHLNDHLTLVLSCCIWNWILSSATVPLRLWASYVHTSTADASAEYSGVVCVRLCVAESSKVPRRGLYNYAPLLLMLLWRSLESRVYGSMHELW